MEIHEGNSQEPSLDGSADGEGEFYNEDVMFTKLQDKKKRRRLPHTKGGDQKSCWMVLNSTFVDY